MSFTLVVFFFTIFRVVIVNRSPLASVCGEFGVWDVKVVFLRREFVGFPATFLVVALDNEQETVCEVEFYRDAGAFVVDKVPCFVSFYHI